MSSDFFLHIGPHKTASTFIQKMLFNNKSILAENRKIYLEIFDQGDWGHHKLADSLRHNNDDLFYGIIKKTQKTSGDLIISSENFDSISLGQIKKLYSSFNFNSPKIIYYKRCARELLLSTWQENIKHGETYSWRHFLSENLLRPFSSNVLNGGQIIEKYESVFGADSISIIDFHSALKQKYGITTEFLKVLGENPHDYSIDEQKVNQSLSFIDVEILRILNIVSKRQGIAPRHELRDKYLVFLNQPKINIEYFELREILNNSLESFTLSDSFTIDFFEKNFHSKFKKYFVNSVSYLNHDALTYQLPSEDWHLSKESIRLLFWLYRELYPENLNI